MRQFSADPLRDPCLHRVNWIMAASRPRLELSIYFERNQKLVLSAQPHEDTVTFVPGHAWFPRRRSSDFKNFQRYHSTNHDAFSTAVLELGTERMSGLNGVAQWGYWMERESAVDVFERRMIASLLRHKIY